MVVPRLPTFQHCVKKGTTLADRCGVQRAIFGKADIEFRLLFAGLTTKPEIAAELLKQLMTEIEAGRSTKGDPAKNDVDKIKVWKNR